MYPSPRRAAGLGLMLLVHLAILLFWRIAYAPPRAAAAPEVSWLDLRPEIAPPPKPIAIPPRSAARTAIVPSAAPQPELPPAPAPQLEAPPEAIAPLPPALSTEDLMRLARREFAGVAREAERARHGYVTTPQLTPQQKLERGIAGAETAPSFYQAPRITEVSDPNGYDRRIYKVEFKGIKYCIYVESNHALDGIDQMRKGIQPKLANCPRE